MGFWSAFLKRFSTKMNWWDKIGRNSNLRKAYFPKSKDCWKSAQGCQNNWKWSKGFILTIYVLINFWEAGLCRQNENWKNSLLESSPQEAHISALSRKLKPRLKLKRENCLFLLKHSIVETYVNVYRRSVSWCDSRNSGKIFRRTTGTKELSDRIKSC